MMHVLCNPGMRERHWDNINVVLGSKISLDPSENLKTMLSYNLEPFLEQLEAVSAAASKEYSLEKAMEKMEDDWDAIVFNTKLYRDTGREYETLQYLILDMYIQ